MSFRKYSYVISVILLILSNVHSIQQKYNTYLIEWSSSIIGVISSRIQINDQSVDSEVFLLSEWVREIKYSGTKRDEMMP